MRQCALLGISRSGRYDRPTGESEQTPALMRLIDEAFPDLLRDRAIVRPNQVWGSDIA